MTPSGPAPRAFAIRRDAPPTAAEVGGQARQPLRRPPDESGPPVLPVCEPTLQSPRLTYRHPYHRSSELQTSHNKEAERFIEDVRGDDPELASYLRIEERELEAGEQRTDTSAREE